MRTEPWQRDQRPQSGTKLCSFLICTLHFNFIRRFHARHVLLRRIVRVDLDFDLCQSIFLKAVLKTLASEVGMRGLVIHCIYCGDFVRNCLILWMACFHFINKTRVPYFRVYSIYFSYKRDKWNKMSLLFCMKRNVCENDVIRYFTWIDTLGWDLLWPQCHFYRRNIRVVYSEKMWQLKVSACPSFLGPRVSSQFDNSR